MRNTKRTRFKIALWLLLFMGVITIYSIHEKLPNVASTAIAGMLTVGSSYILGDTVRPSDDKSGLLKNK